ncbi:Uncharacterized protein Fot_03577 [Forsythia ovata]|uniref:Uncharacterized protein n=1 Tax=Forsythia ovata TaxID=205694 RepID=A0ABD1XA34_9LAMI
MGTMGVFPCEIVLFFVESIAKDLVNFDYVVLVGRPNSNESTKRRNLIYFGFAQYSFNRAIFTQKKNLNPDAFCGFYGVKEIIVHGLGQWDNQVLVDSIGNIHEWDQVRGEKDVLVTKRALLQQWQPAPPRGLKINSDASVKPGAGFYTTSTVIRDEYEFFVAMQKRKVIGQLLAEDAETIAVRDGLILARDHVLRPADISAGGIYILPTRE